MRKGEIAMSREAIGLLKASRNALHWSQDELAREAGVSVATVKRIESKAEKIKRDAMEIMGRKSKTLIRRDSIFLLLKALERHGVSIWQNDLDFGISVRSQIEDQDFFSVAKQVANR